MRATQPAGILQCITGRGAVLACVESSSLGEEGVWSSSQEMKEPKVVCWLPPGVKSKTTSGRHDPTAPSQEG
jgi:hypothetical protein